MRLKVTEALVDREGVLASDATYNDLVMLLSY